MAHRLTDTEVWDKEWFQQLPPQFKCFWWFLFSKCNHAGIWDVNMRSAEFHVNASLGPVQSILDIAFKDRIVPIQDGKKWFIPGFIRHQYKCEIDGLDPGNRVHRSVIQILQREGIWEGDLIEDHSISRHSPQARITKTVQKRIWLRDNCVCQYCSESHPTEELVIDHIIPVMRGGTSSDDNLVTSCVRCNSYKSDLSLSQFLDKKHEFLRPSNHLTRVYKKLKDPTSHHEGAKDKDKDKDIDDSPKSELERGIVKGERGVAADEKREEETEHDPPASTPDRTPIQEILRLYHFLCPSLPTVKEKLGKMSSANLRQRWKEHPDIEWWSKYFESVEASGFLTNRVPTPKDREPFIATFHWLIKPSNMEKVANGYYANRQPKRGPLERGKGRHPAPADMEQYADL